MKTRNEMVSFIRRKLRDGIEDCPVYEESDILDDMETAWEQMRVEMAQHDLGRWVLMTYTSAQDFVAEQEIYDLPDDCLMVYNVQCRYSSDYAWLDVPYGKPHRDAMSFSNGTAKLLSAMQLPASTGLVWYDDTEYGKLRLWPEFNTVSNEQFRIRYAQNPVFVTTDTATLRDPEETGSTVYLFPDGTDTALCYLTASILALEELEDGKPIGVFGSLYAQTMRRVLKASRRRRPRRQHIGDRL